MSRTAFTAIPSRMGLIIALLATLMSIAVAQTPFEVARSWHDANTIRVGVRSDTRPFSYRTEARIGEDILDGYGGYMVEICRRVLSQMTLKGTFANYRVEAVPVTATNRFDALDNGGVHMLCGPDSITVDRLDDYNISHPVFLSGVAYATVGQSLLPRYTYCQGVIGMVSNTTAESRGLEVLRDNNTLQRFTPALDAYLVARATKDKASLATDPLSKISALQNQLLAWRGEGVVAQRGRNAVAPSLVTTAECKNGFERGPVVFYDSHSNGVDDLCEGKILFYIGDVDIISNRLSRRPGCDFLLQRETLSREAYGVFFRRTKPLAELVGDYHLDSALDSTLYAEFNNVLLQKMQDAENILDYEFRQEFDTERQTEDLRQFFNSFQFASNY